MATQGINIPIEELHRQLRYDAQTGKIFWRTGTPCYAPGREIGSGTSGGYRQVVINRCVIRAHRVAWALHYGHWPELQIDHINRDRTDNRIANLRLATNGQNARNRTAQSNNKCGLKGVSRHKGRWRATIFANGKQRNIGYFDDPHEAHAAYRAVCDDVAGEFASI
jgi:hypothetical protein